MAREPLRFTAPSRTRSPQMPHRWPPSMTSEEVEAAIDAVCGCAGQWDCDCVSVFNKARGSAWEKHNLKDAAR